MERLVVAGVICGEIRLVRVSPACQDTASYGRTFHTPHIADMSRTVPTHKLLILLPVLALGVTACADDPDASLTAQSDSTAIEMPVQPVALTVNAADFEDTGFLSTEGEGSYVGGTEAPADIARRHFQAEGLDSLTVDVLDETADRQTLLVTRYGIEADDMTSQDERYRVVFAKMGGDLNVQIPDSTWRVVESGRQYRCSVIDAAAQWSATACN